MMKAGRLNNYLRRVDPSFLNMVFFMQIKYNEKGLVSDILINNGGQ